VSKHEHGTTTKAYVCRVPGMRKRIRLQLAGKETQHITGRERGSVHSRNTPIRVRLSQSSGCREPAVAAGATEFNIKQTFSPAIRTFLATGVLAIEMPDKSRRYRMCSSSAHRYRTSDRSFGASTRTGDSDTSPPMLQSLQRTRSCTPDRYSALTTICNLVQGRVQIEYCLVMGPACDLRY